MIRYERDIVILRKAIQARLKAEEVARAEVRHGSGWKQRVLRQGLGDEVGIRFLLPVRVRCLHMWRSFATEDLSMRYNCLEDDVMNSVKRLVSDCKIIRMLELGTNGMTLSALESLSETY